MRILRGKKARAHGRFLVVLATVAMVLVCIGAPPKLRAFEQADTYFYIIGHIGKPGKYTVSKGLDVKGAIRLAGGASRKAPARLEVRLRRMVDRKRRILVVPMDSSAPVLGGDVITLYGEIVGK